MSCVGTHHQNGVSESSIEFTSFKSYVLLIYPALRRPNVAEINLWPMDLSHAVYLHNVTPRMDIGLSPEKIWTRSKASNRKLSHVNTWDYLVYVLDPNLQNNKKITKWAPCSRRDKYLGVSPLHARTVGLVRNLITGRF